MAKKRVRLSTGGKRRGCFNAPMILGGVFALWIISVLFPSPTAQRNREATQTARSVVAITQPATSTARPSATRQIATVDASTPTINPNLPIQEREDVRDAWLLVEGVVGVNAAMQTSDEFYGEVRVADGLVNADMAAALRGLTPGGDFSVILDDGSQAVAFDWDAADERFRETRLSMVAPSYTPSPSFSTKTPAPTVAFALTSTSAPTNTNQPTSTNRPANTSTPLPAATAAVARDYTVLNSANMRSCTTTNCAVVVRLSGGTVVSVTGSETGESVSGSTQWYIVRLQDGRTGYVHSSLLGAGIIAVAPTAVPPAASNNGGGGGSGSSNTSQAAPATSVPPSQPQWSCSGNIYNCSDFSNRNQLMDYFNACPGDPSDLDGNKDGVPCESLR